MATDGPIPTLTGDDHEDQIGKLIQDNALATTINSNNGVVGTLGSATALGATSAYPKGLDSTSAAIRSNNANGNMPGPFSNPNQHVQGPNSANATTGLSSLESILLSYSKFQTNSSIPFLIIPRFT